MGKLGTSTQSELELMPSSGLPIKAFAHTICLAYLTDFTPEGEFIFNRAIQWARKLFVPKGIRFIPVDPSTGLGGYELSGEIVRRGPAKSISLWLQENGAPYPMTQDTILVATPAGLLGMIRVHNSFQSLTTVNLERTEAFARQHALIQNRQS